jgi:glyoxylate reductase
LEKPKIVSLSPFPAGVIQFLISPYLGGREVEIVTPEKTDEEYLAELIKDADILIGDFTFNIPITKNILRKATKLKLIQQPTVGYQHIDIKGARELNIPVANTAGANDISVAEHTIMLALALLKKLFYAHQKTKEGKWAQIEMFDMGVFELYQKTWGIIGMGKIGKEVAKRLNAFSTNILYYDKIQLPEEKEEELNAKFRPLEKLLRESDIVSLHLPLTEETKNLISEKEINLMKPSAYLINVSRGELVDEEALSKALKQKRISGAGIDVFSEEPISPSCPLLSAPNVILTPHIAGATNESRNRIIQKTVENVVRVLNGENPIDVVN